MTDHLEVRQHDATVAELDRSRSGLWVTYSPEIVNAVPAGTPILSCSLPVRAGRQDATAWARGLLPEGQHLDTLAAAADVAASDTFSLLARYGRDIAGAFEIVTADAAARTPGYVPYSNDELYAEVAGLATAPLAIRDDSELSLAGLQDKMVVVRTGNGWARPVHGYPSTHIVKVDPTSRPGIVDAEAACLRLARSVGLTSVDVERHRLGDREAVVVSRFDRVSSDDGRVTRLHQEDLLQALGISPDARRRRAKYQQRDTPGPPSWWHAAELLDIHADDPTGQMLELVRVVTFTTAIGNADCHAKNVSFMVHDGHIGLAPLYDTVPTALWPTLRASAAMGVADRWEMAGITVDDIVTEACRWRLPEQPARATAIAVLEAISESVAVANHDRVVDLVTSNTRRLLDRSAR